MAGKEARIVEVPQGVEATVEGSYVKVKTPEGEISKEFTSNEVEISKEGGNIVILPVMKRKSADAKAKTAESIIRAMIEGGKGKVYVYNLEIVYSHFPVTVAVKGGKVEINNLRGGKEVKIAKIIGHAKVEVKGKNVIVKSNDKQAAGQTAANIENATRITHADRRTFQDGIYITEKAK